jgi:hypothetical protein
MKMMLKVVTLVLAFAACTSAHYGSRHGLVGGGFGSGKGHMSKGVHSCGADVSMTKADMRTKLLTVLQQSSSTPDLIQLLTAMTMPEGQNVLSQFGITTAVLQGLVSAIQSKDPQQAAQVKETLSPFVALVQSGLANGYLSTIFYIYDLYLQRQAAIATINQATSAQLLTALTVFKSQVKYLSGFSTTAINGLITALQSGGNQGYQNAVTQLIAWINSADCAHLKFAGQLYVSAVGPAFTTSAPGVTSPPINMSTTTAPGVPVSSTPAPGSTLSPLKSSSATTGQKPAP